jgi:hypothetical protein
VDQGRLVIPAIQAEPCPTRDQGPPAQPGFGTLVVRAVGWPDHNTQPQAQHR